jgi:hypothetical protein
VQLGLGFRVRLLEAGTVMILHVHMYTPSLPHVLARVHTVLIEYAHRRMSWGAAVAVAVAANSAVPASLWLRVWVCGCGCG